MAQRVHRNAGMEIEILSAMLVIQAHALPPLESEFRPGVCAVERGHGISLQSRGLRPAWQSRHKWQKRAIAQRVFRDGVRPNSRSKSII